MEFGPAICRLGVALKEVQLVEVAYRIARGFDVVIVGAMNAARVIFLSCG
jgi:hypothetical protein